MINIDGIIKYMALALAMPIAAIYASDSIVIQPEPIRQGLAVITNDPECEVVINGTSRGRGRKVFVSLPPGKYAIAGHRDDRFDDTETGEVYPGLLTTINVNPRKFRPQVQPPAYCAMNSSGHFLHGTAEAAGVWRNRNFIGGFVANAGGTEWSSGTTIDSSSRRSYYQTSLMVAGINYLNAVYIGQHLTINIGMTAGGAFLDEQFQIMRVDSIYYYSPSGEWVRGVAESPTGTAGSKSGNFAVFGPRVAVQGGLEHLKLHAAAAFMIRSDAGMYLGDPRNFAMLEAGVAVLF
jgi:hypothetical protein